MVLYGYVSVVSTSHSFLLSPPLRIISIMGDLALLLLSSLPIGNSLVAEEVKVHSASSISKSRVPHTGIRPHGSIVPVALRSVVYAVRWRMHSIATSTRNNYISLNPLVKSIPGFCGLDASCVQALSERCYGFMLKLIPSVSVERRTQRVWVLDPNSIFSGASSRAKWALQSSV